MFIDPMMEREFYLSRKLEEDVMKFYTSPENRPMIQALSEGVIRDSLAYDILDKNLVTAAQVLPVTDTLSKQMLADKAQEEWVVQESENWKALSEKFRSEKITDDMNLSIIDILSGGWAPGGRTPKEVGNWSLPIYVIGTLDAIRETWNKWNPLPTSDIMQFGGGGVPYRAQGRIWRYYQDLRRYDELLEKGYTPEVAQANISTLVNISQVPNLGRDLGPGEFEQNIDFMKEAIKFAGENYIWAAAKKVMRGEAVNMDRSKRFFFESIHAEEDPMYNDLLLKFGGDEKKAKELYYLKIGSPIKELDANGQINYLSIDNPNKIKIFADRRTNYNDMNITEYAEREFLNDGQLTDYSWGRYEAGQIYQPGTTAYKVTSGLLDFASALPAEYFNGGLLSLTKIRKWSRSTDILARESAKRLKYGDVRYIANKKEAMELSKEIATAAKGRDKASVKAWNNLSKEEKDIARTLSQNSEELAKVSLNPTMMDEVIPAVQQALKADRKLRRKHGLINGRVQSVFAKDGGKLMALPEYKTLRKHISEANPVELMNDPTLNKWIPGSKMFWKKMAGKSEVDIDIIFKDLLGDGYHTASMNIGKKPTVFQATELPKGFSYMTNAAMRKVTGRPDIAMRSMGSVLGAGAIRTWNMSKFTMRTLRHYDDVVTEARKFTEANKVTAGLVDGVPDAWESLNFFYKNKINPKATGIKKHLGFSSAYQTGMSENMKKMLALRSPNYMSMTSTIDGTEALINNINLQGFSDKKFIELIDDWERILELPIEKQYRAKNNFLMDYMETSLSHAIKKVKDRAEKAGVKYQGENIKALEKHANRIITDWNSEKAYWKSSGFDDERLYNMVFPGSSTGAIFDTKKFNLKGDYQTILIPKASTLGEMTDNYFPFLNQDIVDRVAGKGFFALSSDDIKTFKGFSLARPHYKKFVEAFKKDGKKGVKKYAAEIGGYIPTNKTMDDAVTLLLDTYTRKLFKPIVLVRYAFFTRIFLEEQARVAAAGLDSAYNHPFRYLSWVFSHSEEQQKAMMKQHGDNIENIFNSPEYKSLMHENHYKNILADHKYDNQYKHNFKEVNFGDADYADAIYDGIFKLRMDPVTRMVAKEGGVTQPLIEWFLKSNERKRLLERGGEDWIKVARDDEHAIAYLKSRENHIRQLTGHQLTEGIDYKKYSYRDQKQNNINALIDAQLSHNVDSEYIGHQFLRDVIADGKFKKYDSDEFIDLLSESDEFGTLKAISAVDEVAIKKEIQKYIDAYGDEMDFGTIFKKHFDNEVTGIAKLEQQWDKGVNIFFEKLVEKNLNYLNRSVVFKQYRWEKIMDMWHLFDKDLRKIYIDEIKASGLDDIFQINKSGWDLVDAPKVGTRYNKSNYEAINDTSKAFGLAATKELLYDVTKRHNISHKLRNLFPFPEVWFELLTTWPRLIAENPTIVRKVQLGVKGGAGASGLGYTGDGFFTEDPNGSGEQMFVYPFGGWMSNLIFGEDSNIKMSPRGFVTGVNILGQGFVPGPTPMAGYAIDKILPDNGTGDELRSVLFGDFGPPTGDGFLDAIMPDNASLNKFWITLGATPFGNQAEIDSARASTSIELFRLLKMEGAEDRWIKDGTLDPYLAEIEWKGTTADKLPDNELTPDIIDTALQGYCKDKTSTSFALRFCAQFVLPTGFSPRYYAEDKNGKMWATQLLAKEYQNLVQKHGGDHVAAYESFVRLYGYEHGWLTTSKSTSKSGKKAYSDRVLSWQRDNKNILTHLPKSSFYVLPDSPYEERNYQRIIEEYEIGEREVLSLEEFNRAANDTIGYFMYTAFKEKYEYSNMGENEKNKLFRIYRTALIQELPGFEATGGLRVPATSKEILLEMVNKWPNIPEVRETEAGKAFVDEFLPRWKAMENESIRMSPSESPTWWLSSTNNLAIMMRADMANFIEQIIQESPDFAPIWTNIISRMFRDDYEMYMVNA